MSYSGKAGVRPLFAPRTRSGHERLLLRPDLLLKIEGGGVCGIQGQHVVEDLACFGQAARLDETARERDAKVVRVQRGDPTAKEGDRPVGVAELTRRVRGERVVPRDR